MKRRLSLSKGHWLMGVAVVAIVGTGIYYAGGSDAQNDPSANMAIPVGVQTMAEQKVRVWTDFSGRLQAVDSAEIRPEVDGRITEVKFDDGQMVKAGDVLFVIDPDPYEAAVAKAEADLASARTQAKFAQLDKHRAANIVKKNAISRRTYDERVNVSGMADAAVKAAEATLKQARIDLDHAYVKAPISGRVSRAELTVGNLVSKTNAPLLTTVVSNEEIYADFEVDEQTYINSIRNFANGQAQERRIPVQLALQSDKDCVYTGNIYSFDNQINTGSGTIRARAKFKNEDSVLVPGMFVTVSIASSNEGNALLVPEQALGFDQNKKFVYVVGDGNKVAYREVQLGKQVDGSRIVLSGLKPGEKVIVDGVQHVRPDAVVDAKESEPAKNGSVSQKESESALATR